MGRGSTLLRAGYAAALSLMVLSGCGGDTAATSTGDVPDANDGRYHPPGNGKPMSEADACAALTGAQAQHASALGCTSTGRVCPDFLRTQSGKDCLEYDEGAVNGCVQLYSDAKTCKELSTAASTCVPDPLPGTTPKGCP